MEFMLGKQGGKCVCVSAFEMGFEIRVQTKMAKTTKCRMLAIVHFCRLKQQAKSLLVYAYSFCSVCLKVKILSSEFSVTC